VEDVTSLRDLRMMVDVISDTNVQCRITSNNTLTDSVSIKTGVM